MSNNNLVKKSEPQLIVEHEAISINPETLIMKAIDQKMPVEALERLLEMRSALLAERAKNEYVKGLAGFQAKCPIIKKTKHVYNKDGRTVRYSYAPLESIVAQVRKLLQKFGFSYDFDSRITDNSIDVTITVEHIAGRSKQSSFSVDIDRSGYMNRTQQNASALTYAKRYAFNNAFGIMTGDDDDDALSAAHGVEGIREVQQQPQTQQRPQAQQQARPQQKQELTPDNSRQWGRAIEAGFNKGINAVLKHCFLTKENKAKLVAAIKEFGNGNAATVS